jgi:hypothetical protein
LKKFNDANAPPPSDPNHPTRGSGRTAGNLWPRVHAMRVKTVENAELTT